MRKSLEISNIKAECFTAASNRICYLLLFDGGTAEVSAWAEESSGRLACNIVILTGMDWNNDLTPWPAPGVFRKAKPFEGHAASFLATLTGTVVPSVEAALSLTSPSRILSGVSLSGLFSVWAAYNTPVFESIISISGSLWYDGFTEWMEQHSVNHAVRNFCLMLGDREKNSKDRRMCQVEDRTILAGHIMEQQGTQNVSVKLVEGTHFSPVVPRLEAALSQTLVRI